MTVIYGSSVADSALTNACKMSTTTGGSETSKTSTFSGGAGAFGEVYSQSGTVAPGSSLPSPTGHGWVYQPGAGSFAAGNWSASCNLSYDDTGVSAFFVIRFYKYSGGTYTSIGSINMTGTVTSSAKTTYSFANTSMPSVTLGASDYIYVDLFTDDPTGVNGQHAVVYESTSSTAGVVSDMQVTTSAFTASGGGATHKIITDGMGGMFN